MNFWHLSDPPSFSLPTTFKVPSKSNMQENWPKFYTCTCLKISIVITSEFFTSNFHVFLSIIGKGVMISVFWASYLNFQQKVKNIYNWNWCRSESGKRMLIRIHNIATIGRTKIRIATNSRTVSKKDDQSITNSRGERVKITRIRTTGLRIYRYIRILLFSSVAFRIPTKIKLFFYAFCLLLSVH